MQVVTEGKALLDVLQTPVASTASTSITAQADYSVGAGHILDLIHEVLDKNRQIETAWSVTKSKLHQKLGLRLFQKDVQQVRPSSI